MASHPKSGKAAEQRRSEIASTLGHLSLSNKRSKAAAGKQNPPSALTAGRKQVIPGALTAGKILPKYSKYDLPDELFRYIFRMLHPKDLLICACVCKRWYDLANDNMIWQKIYMQYLGQKKRKEQAVKHPSNPPAAYWKSLCIQRGAEERNKACISLLKKINPFTGLPANTLQCLKKSSSRWCLELVDNDNESHLIDYRDSFHFAMATCVRWYSLNLPPINSIKCLRIFSANPVFLDGAGHAHPNSPCQKSLLFETDFNWSAVSSTSPCIVADESIKVHVLPSKVIVATWKDGGELAFVTCNLHHHLLIQRCLLGRCDRPYEEPPHVPVQDDLDSKRGLHGYKVTVELRNQRTSFYSQLFWDVYCDHQDISGGYAHFPLIKELLAFQHAPVGKKITFPWKTDLFKGILQNFCILDLVMLDESNQPMWYVSTPVKVLAPSSTDISYDYDGDHFFIDYMDTKGKFKAKLVWEEELGYYMIMSLELHLSTTFINSWFGTSL